MMKKHIKNLLMSSAPIIFYREKPTPPGFFAVESKQDVNILQKNDSILIRGVDSNGDLMEEVIQSGGATLNQYKTFYYQVL